MRPHVLDEYKEHQKNGGTRDKFFYPLLEIPGMYVPKFYDVEYNEDGTIKSFTPNTEEHQNDTQGSYYRNGQGILSGKNACAAYRNSA